MFSISIEQHAGDIEQIFVSTHPVTGKPHTRVGYVNRLQRRWSLINTHGLDAKHIADLEQLLQAELNGGNADVDKSGDSGSAGQTTDDGVVS